MTRKEKKEELIGLFSTGAIFIGDLIDECFEFGQQHPHWISVEDELPPIREILGRSDIVLVCTAEEKSGIAYYNHVNKAWVSSATSKVTHWMPIQSIETIKNKNHET